MADKRTLFQKIADGDIPGDFVHQDDQCFAIRDINPQAPTHILIIPRKPIPSNDQVEDEDAGLIGHLFLVARDIARAENLAEGYRLVFNCGDKAGQEVKHLHLHLIGGRKLTWPPG
jgi:histidine triad (HIT) family protein